MTDDERQLYLQEVQQRRGYTLDFHKIMAAADLEWLRNYDQLATATYYGQRTLDRKTKELLQTVVLAALRSDVEHIQTHVELALKEGATPQEVLEALETVLLPMGALGFRAGLKAWAAAVGVKPVEVPG